MPVLPAHVRNEGVERRFHPIGPRRSHFGGHTRKHAVTMLLVELLSHEPHHEPRLVGAKAHHAVTGHAPPFSRRTISSRRRTSTGVDGRPVSNVCGRRPARSRLTAW